MIAAATSDLALPTNLTTVDEFEAWQQQPGNDGNFLVCPGAHHS